MTSTGRSVAVIGGASAALGFLVLVGSGASWGSSALLVLVVAAQAFAGAVLWRTIDRDGSSVLLLGMGLALGTAASVLSGLLLQVLGLGTWGWLAPTVIAAAWLVIRRLRRTAQPPVDAVERTEVSVDRPTVVALLLSTVLGLGILAYNLLNYPLSWVGSWSRYHSDMPFFEALSTSLARLGPLDSAFLPGAQVRYHWLVYAWSGQVADAAGAEPFVTLTRVLPFVSILACCLIVVSWARSASRTSWVPSLAVVLLLTGGYLGATYGGVLNFDSPSQGIAVLWLLAYSVVLLRLLSSAVRNSRGGVAGAMALVLVLAFCVMGGKVSAALPALAGVALVTVVGLLRREPWRWRATIAALLTVAGVGIAFLLLMSGASGGGGLTLGSLIDRSSSQQGLNPIEGPRGVLIGTAILLVAVGARWAGMVWLGVAPRHRWQPATVFGFGLALSSLLAIVAFNSFNEIWFAAAASGPLAVLCAVGAGDACDYLAEGDGRRQRSLALWGVVAGLIVYAAVWVLWATGPSGGNAFTSTWRWAGPLAGVLLAVLAAVVIAWRSARGVRPAAIVAACAVVLVFATAAGRLLGVGTGQVGGLQAGLRNEWFSFGYAPSVRDRDVKVVGEWTSGLMEAARWVRTNADPGDLLATNLTFGPFVPSVTGLPTYVSALQYQAPYGRIGDTPRLLAREGEVWDFVDSPSTSTVTPLCSAGVRWLWIDPTLTESRDWRPYASIAFANDDAIILRLDPSSCP